MISQRAHSPFYSLETTILDWPEGSGLSIYIFISSRLVNLKTLSTLQTTLMLRTQLNKSCICHVNRQIVHSAVAKGDPSSLVFLQIGYFGLFQRILFGILNYAFFFILVISQAKLTSLIIKFLPKWQLYHLFSFYYKMPVDY